MQKVSDRKDTQFKKNRSKDHNKFIVKWKYPKPRHVSVTFFQLLLNKNTGIYTTFYSGGLSTTGSLTWDTGSLANFPNS